MKAYQEILQEILDKGVEKEDRTGTGTISYFSPQSFEHDLRYGFPLLTTKKVFFRGVVEELLWFLSGSTNIKPLVDKDVKIWDGNGYDYYVKCLNKRNEALGTSFKPLSKDGWKDNIRLSTEKEPGIGELGKVYGNQWRNFGGRRFDDGYDQVQEVIDSLKNNPDSRRHIINAWNGKDIAQGNLALPPCHVMYQFYVEGELLHMKMTQRSADFFLGVPFNIASSALLLSLIAREVGKSPARLIIEYGDAHIYTDHLKQVKEQLGREPYGLPQITIKGFSDIFHVTADDIVLRNYKSHDKLTGKMSV